jgi:hypothetical protein
VSGWNIFIDSPPRRARAEAAVSIVQQTNADKNLSSVDSVEPSQCPPPLPTGQLAASRIARVYRGIKLNQIGQDLTRFRRFENPTQSETTRTSRTGNAKGLPIAPPGLQPVTLRRLPELLGRSSGITRQQHGQIILLLRRYD